MVKLDLRSPYDAKQYPFLNQWDTDYRANFEMYQEEIDRLTYQLQRSQRGFTLMGSWLYPAFHQRDFLLLDIYKKKQVIGKINQDEVEAFKAINSDIADDLNKTFNASFYVPKAGLFSGLGLNVFAHFFNLQYSFRIGLLVVPVLTDYALRKLDTSAYHNSLEFLSWLTEYRTARARLEFDSHKLQERQAQIFQRFRHLTKVTKPVHEVYDDLIKVISKLPQEDI